MLPLDKSLTSHPSLFQTPVIHKQLNKNPELIRMTDPNTVWDPSMPGQDTKELYNPADPPLTQAEMGRLVARLEPIATVSLYNEQPTLLFYFFMSKQNVKVLQRGIKAGVYRYAGYRIDDQSESELYIVMQNVFKSYAANMNENQVSSRALLKHIKDEVKRLDDIVITLVLPGIIDKIEQLNGFIQYNNNLEKGASLPRPVHSSAFGTREYRPIMDVLVGTQGQENQGIWN